MAGQTAAEVLANRKAKVLALTVWCVRHGVTGAELDAIARSDTARLTFGRIARAAGVNPPRDGSPTWREVWHILGDDAPTAAGVAAERPAWLPRPPARTAIARSVLPCPACSTPVRWVSGSPIDPLAPDGPRALLALDVHPVDDGPDLWHVDEATLTARQAPAPSRPAAERPAGDPLLWLAHRRTCKASARARGEVAAAGGVDDRCECCGAVLDPCLTVPGTPRPEFHPNCHHTRACRHDGDRPRRGAA